MITGIGLLLKWLATISLSVLILREVQKIMDCQDPKNGFKLYSCPKCNAFKHVFFTCKSRFCNCCGAKYSEDRATSISAKRANETGNVYNTDIADVSGKVGEIWDMTNDILKKLADIYDL